MIKPIKYLIYLLCIASLPAMAQSSVLAKGNWFKLGITTSGVYKLDATFFKNLRLDPSTINPKNIKIYGNGGRMLPQANATPRIKDLQENAIWITGEADGKFDDTDAVFFYGQGSHVSFYDKNLQRFKHETNVYSDSSFYFLTIDQSPGLRVKQETKATGQNTITSFDDYVFHEKEAKNLLATFPFAGSGREWFGEEFNSIVQDYTFTASLPNVIANSTILISTSLLAAAQNATDFDIKLNGQLIGNQKFGTISTDRYEVKALQVPSIFTTTITSSTDELKVGFTYNRNSSNNAIGYLNFVGIQAKRALKIGTAQMQFRTLESENNKANIYQIQGSNSNTKIWDISNPLMPYAPFLNNNTTLDFVAFGDQLREFIAFEDQNTLKPVSAQAIRNQDIIGQEVPNLLIITATKFLGEAIRLANRRTNWNGLKVLVLTVDQVLNEFSSGKQDVSAIRDAAKYFFDKDPKTFRYLLLMGDAKFDYKNRLAVVPENTLADYVPIYESRESLNPIYSYSSDDYFGFLENQEGEWVENMSGDHTLDIGIGRLPVKTKQEAKDVVDKLIYYDDNNNRTDGKRNITFVADDGDFNIHQQDADYLAETLTSKYPDFYTKKVFIDALPKVTVATGQKSPKTNELINKALDNSLIINYTGHGGTGGWAEEQILTVGDIQSWKNKTTLPLMVTATCEFGRYDDPSVVSGAELALLKPNAGVIGLLTTTRPVFANTNFLVNDAFYKAVFQPINKQMPRLGDVMIQTKNNSLSGRINRNFSLLGDPSMRLTYPSRKMVLRTINEKPFGNDTLKALQKVVLEGEVLTMDGQSKDSTFNDYFGYTLYDKLTTTTTLGSQSSPMIFKERKDILSIGGYIVNRGTFKISFTMPKDIDYRYGLGKIFFNNAGISKDFSLGSVEIMIGGSGEPALLPDKSPPAVEIKLFVSNWIDDGLVTNANPFFVAKMFDESGINIVNNSIGHELLLTIDDSLKYNLNDYYKRDIYVNTSTGGFVEYQLKDLKVGKHTLKFRAWDVYNNFTERSLSFRVAGQSSTLRTSTQNNPFVGGSEYVSILYYQALSAEGLELNAEIIGQNGQIIRRFDTASMKDAYSTDKGLGYLTWDGKNDSRSLVPKGIYFYRIFVNSALEGSQAVGFGKIGRF